MDSTLPTPPPGLAVDVRALLSRALAAAEAARGRPPGSSARRRGAGEVVLKHVRSGGPCAGCGEETGVGIVGFRGEDRYCDLCLLDLDPRLSLLLLAAGALRVCGDRSHAAGRDDGTAGANLVPFARIYAYLERRYPPPVSRWLREIAAIAESERAS